jgi:hypothetical protein
MGRPVNPGTADDLDDTACSSLVLVDNQTLMKMAGQYRGPAVVDGIKKFKSIFGLVHAKQNSFGAIRIQQDPGCFFKRPNLAADQVTQSGKGKRPSREMRFDFFSYGGA